MGRSKLKTALKAEKGIDIKKLKEKRRIKELTKAKAKRTGSHRGANKVSKDDTDEDGDEEDEEDEEDADGGIPVANGEADDSEQEDSDEEDEGEEPLIDLAALDESSDDSSVDFEEKIERPKKSNPPKTSDTIPTLKANKKAAKAEENEDDDSEEDEDEEDEEIDWADLPPEEREDLVPRTRISINNTNGLLNTLKRFAITTDDSAPFASHQSLMSQKPTAEVIGEDLMDDIKRELAFYAQALDAAKRARTLLKAEGVPFSRPTDYFAEMVKDDGHMEKVKAKLVEEASAKKASAEARKLRDLKKFGKQVQVAKLQERQKAKRETLEKIKTLKRKRSDTGGGDLDTNEADLFDVGVDNELNKYKPQRGGERGGKGSGKAGGPNAKRQKKNEKYGFGGRKKNAKSGDAASSGDLSGFNVKRMKGGAKGKAPKTARLGKSRRKAGAGNR
ncbi:eukaryotic rRNA processing protein EBP2-domain-containing protein [Xylaria intraflava]|nr:eukaryotic rRNA processing protein EBP2-domain-containing protein [Xylaria intraflava]